MFLWKYFVLVVLFALLCVSISGDEQQVDLNEEGASIGTEKEVTYEEALLFESAELGDISGIKKALKRGANINAQNPQGWTALMFSSNSGKIKALNYIAEAGADVNMQENDGWTALFFGAFHGNWKVCERLIFYGADATVHDKKRIYAHATAGVKQHAELSDYISNVGLRQLKTKTDLHPMVKAYWEMLGSARHAELHKDDYGPPYDEEYIRKRDSSKPKKLHERTDM